MIRVSQEEENTLIKKANGTPLATYVRNVLFDRIIIHGADGNKIVSQVTPILTPYPFPYDNWTIFPNPENGKKEPVLVDDGMKYAVCIVSPTGKQILIREGEMFYKDIWKLCL